MQIGYIGLGKMGLAQVARLVEKGWRMVAWNRSAPPREDARRLGAEVVETLQGLCEKLSPPERLLRGKTRTGKRLIWLMVPHAVVDEVLKELVPHLSKGDTVIDGGNSFYKNSMRRASELARRGIHLLDVGVSGGPSGARHGACLMIGGEQKIFKKYEQLFRDLSVITPQKQHSDILKNVRMLSVGIRGSYAYVGGSGAGHFVKMVHNGIEYGMMQSLAEGFALLRAADGHHPHSPSPLSKGGLRGVDRYRRKKFGLNLTQIAELYSQGSVIESRLVGWLAKAFREHGEDLKGISGEVAQSGEGLWTVKTAKELGVPVRVIEDSLKFRIKSKSNPSYTGQVVSALRNQFGGHSVKKLNNS